jgi:hypothetical protein
MEKNFNINCGVTALSSLTSLKKISVKTLNSFAKDNGLTLKSYKLEEERIKTLNFPFIVYTPNHFQFVSKTEDLKGLELTGLVLTEQFLDEPEIEDESIIGETNNEPIPLIDVVIEKDSVAVGVPKWPPPGPPPRPPGYPTQPESWGGTAGDPFPVFGDILSYRIDETGKTYDIEYVNPLFPKDLAAPNTTYQVLLRRGKNSKLTISDLDDNQFALGWGLTKLVHEVNLLKIQNDNLFENINITQVGSASFVYYDPKGTSTSSQIRKPISHLFQIGPTNSGTYSNTINLGSVLSVYDNSFDPLKNEIKINYDGASYSIPVSLDLSGNNLSLLDVSGNAVSEVTLSGGGGSGSIEVISITISVAELTPSFTTPVEVIPAPGVGKMTVPIWGRFRMINGTTTWGEKYFKIYPNGVNFNFQDSAYLGSSLLSTSGKFFSIANADQSQDSDYDCPENESWVLSVANDYVNTSLTIQSPTAAFEVGDTISSSGGTASVVTALPIDKGQQIIYVENIIGSFSTSESVSGQPSGASGTIDKIDQSATPGDYDMELYLGYQTFDLL